MHRSTTSRLLIVFALVVSVGTGVIRAQETSPPKPPEQAKPAPAYHLDFALNELENGKKINTRQYAMNLIAERTGPVNGLAKEFAGRGKEIKIGTRVPIETEQGKLDYMDIGTKIWCRLLEDETGLSLDVRAEVSSLVPRSDTDVYHPVSRDPVVRKMAIEASTAITPSKLTNLGTVDDPDSKRQFQLEVTVTKLR
jgi:hypothetical protein